MKEPQERDRVPVVGSIQEFIDRLRRSRAQADRERKSSERAIRILLKEPPFEADMFPVDNVRRTENHP